MLEIKATYFWNLNEEVISDIVRQREWKWWVLSACVHVVNECEDVAMLRRKLEFYLLLFRCLFQLHVLNCGESNSVSNVASSKIDSGVGKWPKLGTVNNKEKHVISAGMTKHVANSVDQTHNKLTGARKSLIKKLSKSKIIHTGFQNKRLKQELRKRQVSP